MKTALISGITGQTGSYLARHLIANNYIVIGGSRDAESANLSRLQALEILNKVKIISLAPADFRSVIQAIQTYKPDEVYYLAGQTSVGLSFEQPFEAFESIAIGTLNFLEAIRILGINSRFFNAGSTECFGNSPDKIITEDSPMRPVSPYAVAKATSYWITENYRKSYNIFACTGLLSNHESPLRPARFVTSKIVSGIHEIKKGSQNFLELGNLFISRDWGWACDYVDAIHRMTISENPENYIIATGKTHSLMEFIEGLCSLASLKSSDIIRTNPQLLRPSELTTISLSPQKIFNDLNWKSTVTFKSLIEKLYKDELL